MTKHADRDKSEQPVWPPHARAAYLDEPVPYVPAESADDERVAKYAKEIALACGYVDPLRQHKISARAAVSMADAEQQAVASENESLCLEVERLRASHKSGKHSDDCERCYWKGRAVAAEAKVARVEALLHDMEAGGKRAASEQKQWGRTVARAQLLIVGEIRRALDGAE